MTTNSLSLTPAAAATATAAAPVAANLLAVGAAPGQAVRDPAQGLTAGAARGDLGSFLQALQRSAVPLVPGLAAPAVAPVPVGGAAANDGLSDGADAGTDDAELSTAVPVPAWFMAGLVPVAAPALPADLGAGPTAVPDVELAALAPAAVAAASGMAQDLAATPGTVMAVGPAAEHAGTPAMANAAALDTAIALAPAAGANPAVLAPMVSTAQMVQMAPVASMAASAVPQEAPAKPAAFTPAANAGAPDALLGGSALGPEAAAVRERSNAVGSLDKYVADAGALAPGTLNAASPAHNTPVAAARAPSALLEALGERIETQLQRGSERTVIRLDPPMQGQLEITVRRDAGAIQVHLSASNADVVRQLQAISDGLRQELSVRQGGDVSVVVAQHGARDGGARDGSGGRTPEQPEAPGRALGEAGQAPERFMLAALSHTNL